MKSHHPPRVCWEGAGLARAVEHHENHEETRKVIHNFYPYHTVSGYSNTFFYLKQDPELFNFFFFFPFSED